MIRVTYQGSHNFEFDTRLEEIAEKSRSDSSMDFESMNRFIDFEFDEPKAATLFAAAVKSQFPNFSVSNDDT